MVSGGPEVILAEQKEWVNGSVGPIQWEARVISHITSHPRDLQECDHVATINMCDRCRKNSPLKMD